MRANKLRGFERYFAANPASSWVVASTIEIEGDADELTRLVPEAFLAIVKREPRMRVLSTAHNTYTIVDVNAIDQDPMQHTTIYSSVDDWIRHVQDVCNSGFDRACELPYRLEVVARSGSGKARLILYSDHYMSDGQSGKAILHELMQRISGEHIEAQSPGALFPSSLFELMESSASRWTRVLDRLLSWLVSPLAKYAAYKHPVLRGRPGLAEEYASEVGMRTRIMFNETSELGLNALQATARHESASVQSALLVASAIALSIARAPRNMAATHISCRMTSMVDMRLRLDPPLANTTIGYFVGFSHFSMGDWLSMSTRFWDAARAAKQDLGPAGYLSTQSRISANIADRGGLDSLRNAITLDATLSNMGKWPQCSYGQGQKTFSVTAYQFLSSMPKSGAAAGLFISSAQKLHMGLVYHWSDEHAKAYLDALTILMDRVVGSVGPNDTVRDVANRVVALL
ncbi:hypothetical protein HK102_013610 [Quaeritorhiza haematococci]|nr:hypothetical protein HK102_013610 [Quaeritorhiza haematococci]